MQWIQFTLFPRYEVSVRVYSYIHFPLKPKSLADHASQQHLHFLARNDYWLIFPCKETQKNKERYCDNDHDNLLSLQKSFLYLCMHNTPQKGFSSLCFLNVKPLSAKPKQCIFPILTMPTLLHSMELQLIGQEWLFTAMHAFETWNNEERITR